MYGNRTGKLRVGVYQRVGSGMGRNFRRGSVRVWVASSATGTGRVAEMVDPHTPSSYHSQQPSQEMSPQRGASFTGQIKEGRWERGSES